LQVKILRVLQEREFERVGGTRTIKVDVRILAATNKNLEDLVARQLFRDDLFWRLNVIPITLPPLRDRLSDIPLLMRTYRRFNAEKKQRLTVSPQKPCRCCKAITGPAMYANSKIRWNASPS